ncbi:MAG: dynein regulation protein LC7 [Methanomicrobiales archaeon]|nr:dynein regulation protein LC7 [Methanomicrobiales archaeon]
MLEEVLDEFLTIDGVSAALIVGRDGAVIESASAHSIDVDAIGSMVSTCLGSSEIIGGTLALGELHDLTVELDKGPVYLAPLTTNEIIAVVADTTGTVGHVRSELRKNRGRLVAAL